MAGSFLGAFKADTFIAKGQARCARWRTLRQPAHGSDSAALRHMLCCSTLSGGKQAWKEEQAAGGDGRVFFLDAETGTQDAAAAAADDP
jgi:hypothetical protein